MTNCSDIRGHVPVHADGELAADMRAAVDAHLTECQACQTHVEHWQALRRCAQRVLASEALPATLEQQVRERLRKPAPSADRRVMRLFGLGLAAAAAIVFAVTLYLPQGGGTPLAITADELAKVYLECAVLHAHDQRACRGLAPAVAAKMLAETLGFEPLVPDLVADGYFLDGACQCLVLGAARTIHVYYRSEISPDEVISLFSVDRPIKLVAGNPRLGPLHRGVRRTYDVAHTQNDVSVAKWDERDGSFALCAQMGEDELLRLARSVDVACLPREQPALAQLGGR